MSRSTTSWRTLICTGLVAVATAPLAGPAPAPAGEAPQRTLIDAFPGYFHQWPRQRFDRAYGPRVSDHPGYHQRAWRQRFRYTYRDGTWRR